MKLLVFSYSFNNRGHPLPTKFEFPEQATELGDTSALTNDGGRTPERRYGLPGTERTAIAIFFRTPIREHRSAFPSVAAHPSTIRIFLFFVIYPFFFVRTYTLNQGHVPIQPQDSWSCFTRLIESTIPTSCPRDAIRGAFIL